jgi:hypothetical protein
MWMSQFFISLHEMYAQLWTSIFQLNETHLVIGCLSALAIVGILGIAVSLVLA